MYIGCTAADQVGGLGPGTVFVRSKPRQTSLRSYSRVFDRIPAKTCWHSCFPACRRGGQGLCALLLSIYIISNDCNCLHLFIFKFEYIFFFNFIYSQYTFIHFSLFFPQIHLGVSTPLFILLIIVISYSSKDFLKQTYNSFQHLI